MIQASHLPRRDFCRAPILLWNLLKSLKAAIFRNPSGFASLHGTYTHHCRIKSVFVRHLQPDATQKLADLCAEIELKPKITSMQSDSDPARRTSSLALLKVSITAIIPTPTTRSCSTKLLNGGRNSAKLPLPKIFLTACRLEVTIK